MSERDEERWSPEDQSEAVWDAFHGVPWAFQVLRVTEQEEETDDE